MFSSNLRQLGYSQHHFGWTKMVLAAFAVGALIALTPATTLAEGFAIDPASYEVEFSTREAVTVEYALRNDYSEDLNFKLGLEEPEIDELQANELALFVIADDGSEIDLATNTYEFAVDGGTTTVLKVNLAPQSDRDFSAEIDMVLQQTESERRLNEESYALGLKADGTITAARRAALRDAIAVFMFLLAAVFGTFLLLNRRIETNGAQSDQ